MQMNGCLPVLKESSCKGHRLMAGSDRFAEKSSLRVTKQK